MQLKKKRINYFKNDKIPKKTISGKVRIQKQYKWEENIFQKTTTKIIEAGRKFQKDRSTDDDIKLKNDNKGHLNLEKRQKF